MHPIRTRLNAALLAPVFAATVAALLPAASAQAAAIIGAAAVSSNVADFSPIYRPAALIDQSGLSNTYTSGVTDFANYVATTTHNSTAQTSIWGTKGQTGTLTFSFDTPVVLDGLVLWNYFSNAGVKNFRLLDGSGNLLGSYTAQWESNWVRNLAQTFDFAAFSGQSISLVIDSNYSNTMATAFAEVAFRAGTLPPATQNTSSTTAAVPEPGSFALAGLALAGLGLTRRRRG